MVPNGVCQWRQHYVTDVLQTVKLQTDSSVALCRQVMKQFADRDEITAYLNPAGPCTGRNELPTVCELSVSTGRREDVRDRIAYTDLKLHYRVWEMVHMLDTEFSSKHIKCSKERYLFIQSSPKWYLCARKSPYALHPVAETFPRPLKRFQCSSDWRWPSLVLSRKIFPRLLFSRRSMVWCSWLCAHRQCLRLLSTWYIPRRKLLVVAAFPPVYLFGHFPPPRHVLGSTPTAVLEGWMSNADTCQYGLPIPLFTFCSKLTNLWGWWHVWSDCHFVKQFSWGHVWLFRPPSGRRDRKKAQFCL